MNIDKTVQVLDAICDCIPVVSILSNGAQLLYKSARKVDLAANPVNTGWRTDLKIHVLNKTQREHLYAMIPFFGGIFVSLLPLISNGFRDQLDRALHTDKIEIVKLSLARDPSLRGVRKSEEIVRAVLDNPDLEIFNGKTITSVLQSFDCSGGIPEKITLILKHYSSSSTSEVFGDILNLPTFGEKLILTFLDCSNDLDVPQEEKFNLILKYFRDSLDNSIVDERFVQDLVKCCEELGKKGQKDKADQILDVALPKFSRGLQLQVLQRGQELLTDAQINGIIARVTLPNFESFLIYCREFFVRGGGEKVSSSPSDGLTEKMEISLDQCNYRSIIWRLAESVRSLKPRNKDIVSYLSALSRHGEIELLEKALERYEWKLTREDKCGLIGDTFSGSPRYVLSEKGVKFLLERGVKFLSERDVEFLSEEGVEFLSERGVKFLFERYGHEFSNELCVDLLHSRHCFQNVVSKFLIDVVLGNRWAALNLERDEKFTNRVKEIEAAAERTRINRPLMMGWADKK